MPIVTVFTGLLLVILRIGVNTFELASVHLVMCESKAKRQPAQELWTEKAEGVPLLASELDVPWRMVGRCHSRISSFNLQ